MISFSHQLSAERLGASAGERKVTADREGFFARDYGTTD
jgi:hypothetical protein